MTCPPPNLNSNGLPLELVKAVELPTGHTKSQTPRHLTRECLYMLIAAIGDLPIVHFQFVSIFGLSRAFLLRNSMFDPCKNKQGI
jgi:hypothetical protein